MRIATAQQATMTAPDVPAAPNPAAKPKSSDAAPASKDASAKPPSAAGPDTTASAKAGVATLSTDQLMALSSAEALAQLALPAVSPSLGPGALAQASAGEMRALFGPLMEVVEQQEPFAATTIGLPFTPEIAPQPWLNLSARADAVVIADAFSQAVVENTELAKDQRLAVVQSFVKTLHSEWNKLETLEVDPGKTPLPLSRQPQVRELAAKVSDLYRSTFNAKQKPLLESSFEELVVLGDKPVLPPPFVQSLETTVGAFSLFDDPNVSLEALAFIVMMQCRQSDAQDLRDQLEEMQRVNDQKQQLREINTEMKAQKTAVENEMRQEYESLIAGGQLDPEVDFDTYAGWRQVEWAEPVQNDDGSFTWSGVTQLTAPSPPSDIPSEMQPGGTTTGETSDVSETGGTSETSETSGTSGDEPTQSDQDIAEKYGISPKVLENVILPLMEAYGKTDLEKFLENKLDLEKPDDPAGISRNLALIEQAVENAPTAATASVSASEVKNSEKLEGLMDDYFIAKGLDAAGCEPSGLANAEEALQEWLDAHPPKDADAEQAIRDLAKEESDQIARGFEHAAELAQSWQSEGPSTFQAEYSEVDPTTGQIEEQVTGRMNNNMEGGALYDELRVGDDWHIDDDKAEILEECFTSTGGWKNSGENRSAPNGFSIGASGITGYGEIFDDDGNGDFFIGLHDTHEALGLITDFMAEHPNVPELGGEGMLAGEFGDLMTQAANACNGKKDFKDDGGVFDIPASSNEALSKSERNDLKDKVEKLEKNMSDPSTDFGSWVAEQYADDASDDSPSAPANAGETAQAQTADTTPPLEDTAPSDARSEQLQTGSLDQLDAAIEGVQNEMDSMSELSEEMSLRIQQYETRMQQLMETLSNMMKKSADTANSVISNIK